MGIFDIVRNKLVNEENVWILDDEIEQILQKQINLLPLSKSLSKLQYRYPQSKAELRGFYDKFFARHFFQAQNSIMQPDSFERLMKAINKGVITIADIGSGPAVASVALLNIISHICNEINRSVSVNIVLNDVESELLFEAEKVIDTYSKKLKRVYIATVLKIDNPFPKSMIQLKRISRMLGRYDFAFMSYVLLPLKEESTYSQLNEKLTEFFDCLSNFGVGIINQDKFRENLSRRIGSLMESTIRKMSLCQRIYDSNNSYDQYSYEYFRVIILPKVA